MPMTGSKCDTSGVYRCDSCRQTIPLSKGETFPPCAVERKAVNWTLVRTA